MEAVAILGVGSCDVPNPASTAEDVQLGLAFPCPLLLVAAAIAAVVHRGMDGETPPVEVRQDFIFLPVHRRRR